MLELIPRQRRELAPGVVHVPGWLDPERQRMLGRGDAASSPHRERPRAGRDDRRLLRRGRPERTTRAAAHDVAQRDRHR